MSPPLLSNNRRRLPINELTDICATSQVAQKHAACVNKGPKTISYGINELAGTTPRHAEFSAVRNYLRYYGIDIGEYEYWILCPEPGKDR